jgi:DNA-directed RNA polymerase subunit M/transcription elongation factor TFIIS
MNCENCGKSLERKSKSNSSITLTMLKCPSCGHQQSSDALISSIQLEMATVKKKKKL